MHIRERSRLCNFANDLQIQQDIKSTSFVFATKTAHTL